MHAARRFVVVNIEANDLTFGQNRQIGTAPNRCEISLFLRKIVTRGVASIGSSQTLLASGHYSRRLSEIAKTGPTP
jgi:hypothetical protein